MRASSRIHKYLDKNIFENVLGTSLAKELWKKIEGLYQGKGISNRLLLKKWFHNFCMDEKSKVSEHLSVFNSVVYELETIGVKIDGEDKDLRLIWSFSPL